MVRHGFSWLLPNKMLRHTIILFWANKGEVCAASTHPSPRFHSVQVPHSNKVDNRILCHHILIMVGISFISIAKGPDIIEERKGKAWGPLVILYHDKLSST